MYVGNLDGQGSVPTAGVTLPAADNLRTRRSCATGSRLKAPGAVSSSESPLWTPRGALVWQPSWEHFFPLELRGKQNTTVCSLGPSSRILLASCRREQTIPTRGVNDPAVDTVSHFLGCSAVWSHVECRRKINKSV